MQAAVCREDLAVREESFKNSADRYTLVYSQNEDTHIGKPILKANIITSQTPSMIRRIEGVSERQNSPDQRIIHSAKTLCEQRI
jgi:hypothetical protein